MTHIDLPAWNPPRPESIPDIRLGMMEAQRSTLAAHSMGYASMVGRATALPADASQFSNPVKLGTRLVGPERERLSKAHLYHVTADMCALANAVGATVPKGAFLSTTAPTPYGFLLFDEPISSTRHNMAQVAEVMGSKTVDVWVDVPIVAVSWGPLSAPLMVENGPWAIMRPNTPTRYVPPRANGTWVTFYTPSEDRYAFMSPGTVVGYVGGKAVTAKEMAKSTAQASGAFAWENEVIMVNGDGFDPHASAESPFRWIRTVYAVWQMMRQEGEAKRTLSESRYTHRPRTGTRRDQRADVDPGTSRVRVVDVHHRPSAAARERDLEGSTGRRPSRWTHRWQVPPYWRHTCLNPRAHADNGCEHEDQIIPWHVKGDPDLPLKPLTTVRQLSDAPPSRRKT